jgi:hypothetical protein
MLRIICIVSLAAAAAFGAARQSEAQGKTLTILYSGDTYGELESCG